MDTKAHQVYKKLQPAAIAEIIEAVKAITARHHEPDTSLNSEIDYCAVAMFCLADEQATRFGRSQAQRRERYREAVRQTKRISEQLQEGGLAGLQY